MTGSLSDSFIDEIKHLKFQPNSQTIEAMHQVCQNNELLREQIKVLKESIETLREHVRQLKTWKSMVSQHIDHNLIQAANEATQSGQSDNDKRDAR